MIHIEKLFQFVLVTFFVLSLNNKSQAQVDLNDYEKHENKIFTISQLARIQSHYIDGQGLFSHDLFLREKGLYPMNEEIQTIPYFSVSYLNENVTEKEGGFVPGKSTGLLNIDFHIKTTTSHNSVNVAAPIWDGRVYDDNYEIIVGGYSSKFNERPIGKIDEKGDFVSQLKGEHVKEFPILQIPAEQIIFDPFEYKLLKIKPSNGEIIISSVNHFLPVSIYGQQGETLGDINFELVNKNSSIVLFAILNEKKLEVASCKLNKSAVVKSREGYQPELIEGCSQPENGKVVTFTFEGEFSKNIKIVEDGMYLAKDINYESGKYTAKAEKITIDGDFHDWRNVPGVSDYEGDFVSYLYKNPDTDLLEVKVTNDDKYLYMYTRVVGAHGRTGDKGRYYWYSYIDVDANVNTGYPPTRGDNCYFGIPIGDDSEAQFEFIDNKFIKSFFGFTGIGAEKESLSGVLELGPSHYSSSGMDGKKRDSYKVEYVNRGGSRFATHDYTPGTSEDIIVALSPDGSEVEVKTLLSGFLKDKSGTDLMYVGKKINIALGVEGSSDHYGSGEWGADSSPVIYNYLIKFLKK
ncbi:MAG: hypothetical protein HQ522_10330 [Bacteroidetes bacterium]|nr:hypothetical protein [Bacteroidota bacterium]